MVLGRRDFSRCVYAGIVAARWTRKNLSREHLRYLDALPGVMQVAPTVVVCHGTPDDADTYVSNAQSATTALDQLGKHFPAARLLVCGHTHHAALYCKDSGFQYVDPDTEFAIPRHGYALINPGAVGQSRDGSLMARYALLNIDEGRVRFFGQTYEHAVTVRKLRRAGLVPEVDMQRPTGLAKYVAAIRKRWAKYRHRSNPRFH
jgi:diadenosine tetraphosphatase ApaH/serine/threonine PP2A family protein phosphatase